MTETIPSATIEVAPLAKALKLLAGCVERKSTIPILSHVMVSVMADHASITATNLDQWLRVRVAVVTVTGQPFAFCAPAQLLTDMVARFANGGQLSLRSEGGKIALQAGRSRYALKTLGPEDFPPMPAPEEYETFEISAGLLLEGIEDVAFSAATDDARWMRRGVALDVREEEGGRTLTFAALDHHRGAYRTVALDDSVALSTVPIVPSKAIAVLTRLLDGQADDACVEVEIAAGKIAVDFGDGLKFLSRLVDAQFPDYRKPFPTDNPIAIEVDADELDAALQRLLLVEEGSDRAVSLSLSGNLLRLAPSVPGIGDGSEELAVDYGGEDFRIGFSAVCLRENVSRMRGGIVRMELAGGGKQALITGLGGSARYILAPCAI
jgi:DNA polymerase-3 subunit beta